MLKNSTLTIMKALGASQSLNKIAFQYQGKLLQSKEIMRSLILGVISNVNFDILPQV